MSSPNITLACGALLLCLTGCHSPRVAKSGDPAPRQSVHIPIDTITSLAVSQLVDTFQVVPIRVPPDERIGKIARICPGPAHSLFILDKVGPTIHVIDGAFAALQRGDLKTHDEMVAASVIDHLGRYDKIALAQASMARATELLTEQQRGRVFSSPELAIERLAAILTKPASLPVR